MSTRYRVVGRYIVTKPVGEGREGKSEPPGTVSEAEFVVESRTLDPSLSFLADR